MAADAIKRAVEGEPGVVSAHTVAGEASALLHVMAHDTKALELALERIRATPGVTRTVTGVVPSPLSARGAPVPGGRPPSIRDFMTFERHVATTRGNRGQTGPDA